ncbi:MAG TPA: hypothetical protein VFC02_10065 [Anaerolineales bacterium]|nr:hypothetical protein [Anaerolineales bacterium]
MTISELIIVTTLYCFDFIMNLITGGRWEQVRGDQKVIVKIRK